MVLQPYFGIWSDQLGRRQPFILLGTLAIVTSLVGLAFVPVALSNIGLSSAAQSLAVLFMVALNMAIQPLQGGLRAQLSDACSRSQQPAATAFAGIVVSASNVASYLMALVDLPQVLSLGGNSQFSILCVMTSVALALTVALTCLGVREGRDYTVQRNQGVSAGAGAKPLYIATSLRRLPRQVRQVYKVQFLAWMGWFPFLFYMATHIAGISKPANAINNARRTCLCANSLCSL
jgi:solute carrier family 45, member 1/2/4